MWEALTSLCSGLTPNCSFPPSACPWSLLCSCPKNETLGQGQTQISTVDSMQVWHIHVAFCGKCLGQHSNGCEGATYRKLYIDWKFLHVLKWKSEGRLVGCCVCWSSFSASYVLKTIPSQDCLNLNEPHLGCSELDGPSCSYVFKDNMLCQYKCNRFFHCCDVLVAKPQTQSQPGRGRWTCPGETGSRVNVFLHIN